MKVDIFSFVLIYHEKTGTLIIKKKKLFLFKTMTDKNKNLEYNIHYSFHDIINNYGLYNLKK